MISIEIIQEHSVCLETAKALVMELIRDLGDKYGLQSAWKSDAEATVTRSGLRGNVAIGTDRVCISIELTHALHALKGAIEREVRRRLVRLFETKPA